MYHISFSRSDAWPQCIGVPCLGSHRTSSRWGQVGLSFAGSLLPNSFSHWPDLVTCDWWSLDKGPHFLIGCCPGVAFCSCGHTQSSSCFPRSPCIVIAAKAQLVFILQISWTPRLLLRTCVTVSSPPGLAPYFKGNGTICHDTKSQP